MLRKHQKEHSNVTDRIIERQERNNTTLLKVTPGGGKSLIPILAGKLIQNKLADCVCWVVPRNPLKAQGESNFQDPFFRDITGVSLDIRSYTNESDPCRGLDGIITTYQAFTTGNNINLEYEFMRKRFILILDEFHHVEQGGAWYQALLPFVTKAPYLILMTGTLERGDGNRIAYIPYDEDGKPDLTPRKGFDVVEYSRIDALKEKAIIPLHFTFHDGRASWKNDMGTVIDVESISKIRDKKLNSAAVYTALSTEYAQELTLMGVKHWIEHRKQNKNSKLLIVTANIKHAEKTLDFLRSKGLPAKIATSHDSDNAHKNIKAMKENSINILVTIAMAYEGLDVPGITHIICLTHIRSRPWIEQMFARGVRVDPLAGPYEKQKCFVFAPDDHVMRKIVEKIKKEQLSCAKKTGPKSQLDLFDENDEKDEFETDGDGMAALLGIDPLSSSLTGHKDFVLDENGFNIANVRPMPKTPAEKEKDLRAEIERHIRAYSLHNRFRFFLVNSKLKERFQKPRKQMTINELESVLRFVKTNYVIENGGPKNNNVVRGSKWQAKIPVIRDITKNKIKRLRRG
jgi:superfamily II DNA or RNA helicase